MLQECVRLEIAQHACDGIFATTSLCCASWGLAPMPNGTQFIECRSLLFPALQPNYVHLPSNCSDKIFGSPKSMLVFARFLHLYNVVNVYWCCQVIPIFGFVGGTRVFPVMEGSGRSTSHQCGCLNRLIGKHLVLAAHYILSLCWCYRCPHNG